MELFLEVTVDNGVLERGVAWLSVLSTVDKKTTIRRPRPINKSLDGGLVRRVGFIFLG